LGEQKQWQSPYYWAAFTMQASGAEEEVEPNVRGSRRSSMKRLFKLSFVLCSLCLSVSAQVTSEPATLVPGQPVEREIAGGESHTYQITLTSGQFVRVRLEQRAIDAGMTLTAPDGKQLVEMDLTGIGEVEPLSLEVVEAGIYRLTVRASEAVAPRGSYRLETAVQAAATAQDRKRLAAEALLVEVSELNAPKKKNAPQVIEKLQQALPLWRELEERSWIAYSLYLIGSAHIDLSQFGKAIEFFEQALVIRRDLKLRPSEATTLYALGFVNNRLSRAEKAIDYFEQALAIYRELKDRTWEGRTIVALSGSYTVLGRYEKAIEYREQALAISREVKDRRSEAQALNGLGGAYYRLGRTEKAIEYYEQALTISREVQDRVGEESTLGNLAGVYNRLGRNEKAIEYFEQALTISRETRDREGEGWVLNNLGVVNSGLSRYEKAIEYFEQALEIFRDLQTREREGNALINIGGAYSEMGRNEKAIEYYEQALAIYRERKIRDGEGSALLRLGSEYASLGRTEKAIEYFEQSLTILREVKNRPGEARVLKNLGIGYESLGRHEKAISYQEQALAIAREVQTRNAEGGILVGLGKSYRSLGRLDDAVSYHEKALLIAREIKAQADEADALKHLAIDERSRGNLVRARALIEASLEIAESLRIGVVSKESRAGFLAGVQSSYQLYTDLLMRQHQAEPGKGFDALALEVSERQRARSLLDLLTEARADLRQGVDAALIERERTLSQQLNDKAQGLLQATKPEQIAALKQELSQLETAYERMQSAIRKASPHYAALTQPQPLKVKEIQAQLNADTLLLEYALGEERSYLWAINKASLTSYELPQGEVIEKQARLVHELLSARSTSKRGESASERQQRIAQAEAQLPAAAQVLSRTLLTPVAAQLGNQRLVIVADGALQYIPFAMLAEPRSLDFGLRSSSNPVAQASVEASKDQRPKTKDQPLIVNHEVVSLPSASALAIQRNELAGRQPAPKMLAVIADPVFDRSDTRFTAPAAETGDKTQTQTIGADDVRSIEHLAEKSGDKSGVTTLRLIPRLPFTRQEATRVLALAPKNSSFGATDFQASRATVLDPVLSQYRYLHIATHGLLDTERPGLSALLFSMVDAQGRPQNGFLRANDIYNLKLPAELVVLSACQTGLGKEIKGEGLVGLTRGFMYAGAARVVVSLWNVNDKATADLMTKFYEKMLKQGQRPAAALRAAQVEMWKQKQWQSPYYWAAFTMQGEWR
jgi:tetratricopeptide (TPR) repeat protein